MWRSAPPLLHAALAWSSSSFSGVANEENRLQLGNRAAHWSQRSGQQRTSWSMNCGAGGLLPGETHHLRPRDTLWPCGTFRLLHILQKSVLHAEWWEQQKPQGLNFCGNHSGTKKYEIFDPWVPKPTDFVCQSRVPLVLWVWPNWLF